MTVFSRIQAYNKLLNRTTIMLHKSRAALCQELLEIIIAFIYSNSQNIMDIIYNKLKWEIIEPIFFKLKALTSNTVIPQCRGVMVYQRFQEIFIAVTCSSNIWYHVNMSHLKTTP